MAFSWVSAPGAETLECTATAQRRAERWLVRIYLGLVGLAVAACGLLLGISFVSGGGTSIEGAAGAIVVFAGLAIVFAGTPLLPLLVVAVWLNHLATRREATVEAHVPRQIRYLPDQDGERERALKEFLRIESRRHRGIERAYLVRVECGDATPYEVALRLRVPEDRRLVRSLGKGLAEVFGRGGSHLEIRFLDDAEEAEVEVVCQPFYQAA